MIRKELITDLTLEAGGALAGAHVVYHTSQEAWDGRKTIIKQIYKLNPDVTLISVGCYNPTTNWSILPGDLNAPRQAPEGSRTLRERRGESSRRDGSRHRRCKGSGKG